MGWVAAVGVAASRFPLPSGSQSSMLGSILRGPAKLLHCELCPTPIPEPLPLFLWLPRLALFLVTHNPSVLIGQAA